MGSDCSGGCYSNTFEYTGHVEEQDCREGEGLKTTARLPQFSELFTPFVGESASIVVTNIMMTQAVKH